jgi:hypothetical protein
MATCLDLPCQRCGPWFSRLLYELTTLLMSMLVAVAITRSLTMSLAVASGLPFAVLSPALPVVVSSIITMLVVALAAVSSVDRGVCY